MYEQLKIACRKCII